jgi:hypothetical protein
MKAIMAQPGYQSAPQVAVKLPDKTNVELALDELAALQNETSRLIQLLGSRLHLIIQALPDGKCSATPRNLSPTILDGLLTDRIAAEEAINTQLNTLLEGVVL